MQNAHENDGPRADIERKDRTKFTRTNLRGCNRRTSLGLPLPVRMMHVANPKPDSWYTVIPATSGLKNAELFIPDSQSLKDKRQVLLSLKDRLREKFNLSVAEVDGQDLWQRAVLGLACVANEGRYVNQVCDQALNLIRSVPAVEIVQSRVELL